MFEFSPHPWGWTAVPRFPEAVPKVFPTPVGMDLQGCNNSRPTTRFPHTRGDGPWSTVSAHSPLAFSPHPWGWTAWRILTPGGRRFPHTRGDGPPSSSCRLPSPTFSPHPWGWTGGVVNDAVSHCVFPTPVGMDR